LPQGPPVDDLRRCTARGRWRRTPVLVSSRVRMRWCAVASRRVRPLRQLFLLVEAAVLPAVSPHGALERRLTRQSKRRASVPVGANDCSAAEHAVAADVFFRAAAFAAADATGASAPTPVPDQQPPSPAADGAAVSAGVRSPASERGRRELSPAPLDVCAGSRSLPASPPSPSSPNAAV